jgi:GNAT superfamily N-acetyltransferase
MLSSWPPLLVAHDGSWVWRSARGHTERANSIQCLDPADGANVPLRLGRLTELYARHGRRPVFRITPLTAPSIEPVLDGLNWGRHHDSNVLTMSMRARGWEPHHHTALFDPLDPQWHLTQAGLSGLSESTIETLKLMLAKIPCDTRGVLAYDKDGVPAAAALASVINGLATFVNVIVRDTHRGQGLGRSVMGAALNWTRDAGAIGAGLSIAADNAVAKKLYGSLGFAYAYDYHYRAPRQA